MNARRPIPGPTFQDRLLEAAVTLNQRLYPTQETRAPFWAPPASLFFNLLGGLVGLLLVRFPGARAANRVTAAIAHYKSGRTPPALGGESLNHLALAGRLRKLLREKTGRQPRVMVLLSHPDTTGEEAPLLGDLVDRAVAACDAFDPPVKLRLVQAIDDFALDLLDLPRREAYAGLVAAGHIAMDRFPTKAPWLRRTLFRGTGYDSAIYRILKALSRGEGVCMAPGGAVAHNGRVLYAIREFAGRLWRSAPRRESSKQRFIERALAIATSESAQGGLTGTLSVAEEREWFALMEAQGIPEAERGGRINELQEELGLSTSYRTRLFRILFRRICARGGSLLLVCAKHTAQGRIGIAPPLAVTACDRRTGSVTAVDREDLSETREDEAALVKRLVRSFLNS